jgi:hypothetical protein
MHTTRQNRELVATMLSLDMMGAFDRVLPAWWQHNKRKRKVPE